MGLDNYAVYAQKNNNGNYDVAPNELFSGEVLDVVVFDYKD